MPKRKDRDEDPSEDFLEPVKKHSLDSDEEDEARDAKEKYDVMKQDEIEGQEDSTIAFDGDIQITPFNMDDELEEGHFDKQGNYIWHKNTDEIRDGWLDNIDWVKVKPRPEKEIQQSDSDDEVEIDPFEAYKKILEMLKPGETIARALKRLGGKKSMSASERWKKKKRGESVESEGNKEELLKLTGFADQILHATSNMDVYQETYEAISFKVHEHEKKKKQSFGNGSGETLDMFADDTEVNRSREKRSRVDDESEEKSDEVMWEFKWDDAADAEIHGPHSSTEMQQWSEEGYFESEVVVRKCGSDGQFYNLSRIDFELYT